MKISNAVPIFCFIAAAAFSAKAADEIEAFGSKIDAWMEGSIVSIDSSANKLTVHGAKRPYSTEYAKMLREINTNTAKLTGTERDSKTTEIRNAWADSLNTARRQARDTDSDFNFRIPGKDGMVVSHDELKMTEHLQQ